MIFEGLSRVLGEKFRIMGIERDSGGEGVPAATVWGIEVAL